VAAAQGPLPSSIVGAAWRARHYIEQILASNSKVGRANIFGFCFLGGAGGTFAGSSTGWMAPSYEGGAATRRAIRRCWRSFFLAGKACAAVGGEKNIWRNHADFPHRPAPFSSPKDAETNFPAPRTTDPSDPGTNARNHRRGGPSPRPMGLLLQANFKQIVRPSGQEFTYGLRGHRPLLNRMFTCGSGSIGNRCYPQRWPGVQH